MARNLISIENTSFIFKTNFAGDPERDNYGSTTRYCNIVIPTQAQADELAEMGLNVRCTKPKPGFEEEFTPTYFIKGILRYHNEEDEDDSKDPKVYQVIGDAAPILLNEDTVQRLDDAYITNVNVLLNPYFSKRNNRWSCYIQTLYAEQDMSGDPFASKYAHREPDVETMPFD